MMLLSMILDHEARISDAGFFLIRNVSITHVCVMHVKNGDGRTDGKLNSRSRMRAFQGTFAVDIWSIKCCVVNIWSIFGFFFWWSIFDKTPVAGLLCSTLNSSNSGILNLIAINPGASRNVHSSHYRWKYTRHSNHCT